MEFHIGNARHAEQHSADSEQRNLMSTTIKTTIQEDREIINAIILHIVSTERRDDGETQTDHLLSIRVVAET